MVNPALATPVLTAIGGLVTGLITAWLREEYVPHSYKERRSNLESLRTNITEVREMLVKLQAQANGTAVLQNDAISWMQEAEDILNKIDIEDLQSSIDRRCMKGVIPDCCSRCAAGGAIAKEINVIDKLIEKNKQVCLRPVVKGYQRGCNETVMRTRKNYIKKIWECLSRRHDVKVLSIHGVAGVGKTAIAEAIYNKALSDEHDTFYYVIWVAAEYGDQLKILQEKVARSLNISLLDISDDAGRATKLHEEFMLRKKCLVIIDFLWEDFSLREIGIPESDDGEVLCKVMLTSRSRHFCPRITKDEYIEIGSLSRTDSYDYFKRSIGDSFVHVEIDIREKAIQDCAGLPLAILMLAMPLREIMGQSLGEINVALQERLNSQARSTPSTVMLFERLEYSFERLEERCRKCFLYCALFPKGYSIEVKQLIDFWMWEGLLDTYIESLEVKRKLGVKVLKELKDARLLETVDSDSTQESVKMLGLFHTMAVNIISKRDNDFFINAGDYLTVLPTIDDQNGNIKRASFVHNQLRAPTKRPNIPNLSTLLLQDNPIDWFSLDFFTGMPNLKILDLSYTHVSFLPPSACTLKLLQVLLLRHCPSLKNLPDLSNLEELIVLDLFGSPLEKLPAGMQKLNKLRRLDLSHTKLIKFPAGLVGALPCLQELLVIMDDAKGYCWRSRQVISTISRDACVEELALIESLTILELNFFNVKVFNNYMSAFTKSRRNLCCPSFRFCVGGFCTNGNLGKNSIALIGDYFVDRLPEGILELYLTMHTRSLNTLEETRINFEYLKVLNVFDYRGLKYLFSVEMLNRLHSLEKISVTQCWSMKGLIRLDMNSNTTPSCFLPRLQELVLIDLPLLESIYSEEQQLDWPVFQSFSVWNCETLKKLPRIVNEDEDVKKIKIKGHQVWFNKLDPDASHHAVFVFEEANLPINIASFVSVKVGRFTNESIANDGEKQIFNFFKRKTAEKARAATIKATDDANASPTHSQSRGYITRRLEATSTFFKKVQANLGLFTEEPQSYDNPSSTLPGTSSVPMITPTNSRRFKHFPFL